MMKKLTLIFTLALFAIGFSTVEAQNVAHINSNLILEAMPDYQSAQTRLKNDADRHRGEVERQQKELQEMYEKAMTDMQSVQNKSEAERNAMIERLRPIEEQLQTKQQALQQYQNTATQDLQKKEADLLQPIYERVEAAVQAVGQQKNVGYIFDLAVTVSSGSMVYFAGGNDITNDVKKHLGL
ncbi:MAG: OmpH family outer membrane protein [Weeksellaceae bacterium]|nr:OmpH family outer membrane protein [Weeksellaceae bacterium]